MAGVKKKLHHQGVLINGCRIVNSNRLRLLPGFITSEPVLAARCKHYVECPYGTWCDAFGIPKDKQCLAVAAKMGWSGFDAVECGYNPAMADKFKAILIDHHLSGQRHEECVDWLYG
jgi:hypothetical protein